MWEERASPHPSPCVNLPTNHFFVSATYRVYSQGLRFWEWT